MKKFISLVLLVLMATLMYSCTPQSLIDDPSNPESCCGDDFNGLPPSGNTGTNGG